MSSVMEAPKEKFRTDYKSLPYDIESVYLKFDVKSETSVEVSASMKMVPKNVGAPLELDGEDLTLKSLKIDGKDFENFEVISTGGLVVKELPEKPFLLETVVEIDPKGNTQLSGLYASSGNLCTQCEAEGFRRITYFYDRPDCMTTYKVRVEADKKAYPVLLSNGNEIQKGDLGDRHYAEFEDPFKKPSYLFALVAGDLGFIEDTFTTVSGRKVKLYVWSEHHNVPALEWSMESLKTSMKWDEDTFGREYDLDVYHIVAVDDFNMGAMENKGLNVFNTACVLAKPTTATDSDYERVLGVVAHEYFHNWSGNRVTCRDWFQLTLKEGLTVFRDQLFSEDMTSEAVKRIEDVRIIRSAQFTQDASPLKHPIRPESYVAMDNFYTVTVYNKGAEVIRMYRTLLGKKGFRKGLDLYFERHDGEAVTCDDFRKAMADANNVNLDQFEEWYKQAGTPTVTVTNRKFDSKTNKYSFTLTQSNDKNPPLHIPISAAIVSSKTGHVSAPSVLELTKTEETFELKGPSEGDTPSLLRGFSAPVKLLYDPPLDVAELQTLASYDDDAFSKWNAWQQLATRVLLDRYRGNEEPLPDYLTNAFLATLRDDSADASLRAYSLALPDYSSLALDIDDGIDPQKLCAALKSTREDLAKVAENDLKSLYESLTPPKDTPFSVDAKSVGQRRLRNACLSYLTKLKQDDLKLACAHFDAASCMTDSIAAASILAGMDKSTDRDSRLETFYERAKKDNEDLVINKWFAIQATADRDNALDHIKELTKHPDFTDNPNRFRSLVFSFASNPNHFHTKDGYDWIVSKIQYIDKKNPQVAARLANVFGSWRRYDKTHADLMQNALTTLKDTPGLSKDTLEIATRSLG